MKYAVIAILIFTALISMLAVPRVALGYLTPQNSPLPNPSLNFRGGATTTDEQGQGGEVVGDGTPASCTDTALTQALAGGGEITFDCGPTPHAILLASQKVITAETSIDGGGLITLSGVNVTRHFVVNSGVILQLRNVTLAAGAVGVGENGGAIRNDGVLTTDNVTFTHNLVAAGEGGAGAIYNNGGSLISNTRFIDNRAPFGGALANTLTGTVTITNSTFLSNTAQTADAHYCSNHQVGGGGINNKGTLSYSGGWMQGNGNTSDHSSTTCGGAIANYGTLLVEGVELRGNVANTGGALYSVGSATLDHAGVIANHTLETDINTAQAVWAWNDPNVAVAPLLQIQYSEVLSNEDYGISVGPIEFYMDHSTVAHNTDVGLAFYDPSHAFVSNSTFSHNLLGLSVVKSLVPVRVFNSTLVNTNTDVAMFYTSTLWLQNTVLAGSEMHNCYIWDPNLPGYDFRSDGYNLSDDSSCAFTQTTDYSNTEAFLGALQDNGGDTLTHLPAANSPLLEHGLCLDFVADDQRGVSRPQGIACDIGAVERTSVDGATPTPTATVTATPSATPTLPPNTTATPTPTGTPSIFTERLYLPLMRRD